MEQLGPHIEFIIKKLAIIAAGVIGAFSLLILWRPKALEQASFFVAGLFSGLIGMGAALSLSDTVVEYFKLTPNSNVSVSYVLGLLSIGVINLIGNFFRNGERNNHDIFDAIKRIWSGKPKG